MTPYFLWDYQLEEQEVRRILVGSNETDKRWLLARILESARFEDIWKYTTLAEVRRMFPTLKLKPPIKEAWEQALSVWQ